MIVAAVCVVGPTVTVLAPVRIEPPAEFTSELNHTDEALVLRALLLDVVRLPLLGERDRVVDHLVPGRRGLGTRSLRYQSSWVFEFSGAA